jgi:hypothetical protein
VTRANPFEVQRAWRGCIFAALLNAFGTPIDWPIGRHVPGMPWWPYAISATIGALLAAFLLGARRRFRSVQVISILFVVNATATLVVLWVTGEHYATAVRTWMPFQPNKLGAMTVALLAPEIWAGLLSIAGYTGAAVLQFLTFDRAVRERLPMGEPWAMLAFGVFATVLLLYRRRQFALERALVREQAETESLKRLARLSLVVRDLANTPTQTIALTSSLIRAQHPDLEREAGLLSRSADKLAELNRLLSDEVAVFRVARD